MGAITEEALELDPSHRSEYLGAVCGDDSALQRRVEALIAADHDAGPLLDTPAAVYFASELNAESLTSASSGRRLGPYRITRPLGAGGFGDVFLAVRADDHYEQQVAIKVLRQRIGDDDARRRILAERQILARLEHPNIARLYDGGATRDGRPYLVMEYVDGLPIDVYCTRRALGLEARLELFRTLCSAVQLAHRSFVVHRDLKPSNILVTHDGTLKLLDFSIAKTISPEKDLLGAETATGSSPMTLAYASPEQIHGEPVKTATDVHGLGIVLYRLLTGRHPFATEGKPIHVVADLMCFSEPVPPSRATEVEESSPGAANAAGDEDAEDRIAGLPARLLVGDLDAITLRALAKRQQDRYPTVDQLSADLERHLQQRPISARPPSFGYRLRKAISRHRTLTLLAGTSSLLILAFILALVVQVRRASAEAQRARREAASAEEVTDFLVHIISARPDGATARELLSLGRQQAQIHFDDQPESLGRVLESIGTAYERSGLYSPAAEALAEARRLRSDVYGERSFEVARILRNQATVMKSAGDYAGARQVLREALEIVRSSPDPDELAVAAILQLMGGVSWNQGRFRESERHTREALRIRKAHHGDLHSDVVNSLNNLALAVHSQGRYAEGEALLLECISLRERFQGPTHTGVAIALLNLGNLYKDQRRFEEAEPLYLRSLSISRQWHGNDHPHLGHTWSNLGDLYLESGRLESAEEALTEARRILDATFEPKHPWRVTATMNSAKLRLEQGRLEEAEELGRRAAANAETFLGPTHPLTVESLETRARILARLDHAEAPFEPRNSRDARE
ncbi:MAG: serine/threonine-protein kinase [Holophagales bacterium]|nr:serine/threonine-protein kinase [Holophagales bacterium]